MNKDIYKDYVLKNIFKEKQNIKMIIIIVLVLLVLNSLFSFVYTIKYYLQYGIKHNNDYRTFFVIRNENIKEDEAINDLKEINHVVNVFLDTSYFTIIDGFSNDFIINGVNNKTIPKIIKGRNFKNDYEIICPKRFLPMSNLDEVKNITKKDFINMFEYLDKTMPFYYTKFDSEGTGIEQKEIKLKIVGIYENSKINIDENICYGSNNLVGFINNDIYENIDMSSQINSIIVQVDNILNIKEVINEMIYKGYSPSQALSFDYTFLNVIQIISFIILLLGVVFIFFIFIFNNKKNYENYINEVKLLYSFGFNNKQINKLVLLKKYIVLIISILIFIILIIFVFIIYNILINYRPLIFSKIPIKIDALVLSISFIVILLIVYITNKILINKIERDIL